MMAAKKKPGTSSDSSSGSSSNSSSSSASDSGSSSDSDSSSSSGSGSATSNDKEIKQQQPPQKVVPRKGSEVAPTKPPSKAEDKPPPLANKNKDRVVSSSTTKVMQQKLAKATAADSSDDDETPTMHKHADARKAPPKATMGGKAPPAVLKQHHATGPKSTSSGPPIRAKAASQSDLGNSSDNAQKMKKKSIFSPENSSESGNDDDLSPPKQPLATTAAHKGGAKTKNVTKASAKGGDTDKLSSNPKVSGPKSSSDSSEDDSSSSDDDDDDGSSDSDSDSDSSDDSSPPAKKPVTKKAQNNKTPTKSSKRDSEMSEDGGGVKNPVRKLTRSASTRKSKHLTGKDSESESEEDSPKRSESKSPVKKAPTKGKTKNSNAARRNDSKLSNHINQLTHPVVEERRCPSEHCNSMGHLTGQFEKHFTIEACPKYHNVTISETKAQLGERKKREEERQRAVGALEANKNVATEEQKNYLQKVRDLRSKFKPTPNVNGNSATATRDAEPNLSGCISDYDLQMFRDAQALAAERIEGELKKFPASRGTKFIIMGKFKMDVWYQSPYPEDVARLPKLYICEFCLRYQKSEVGMKRHAAKCVWRHPPGDEIYRKGKLSVWQVDGKRHKQYCQLLCLLAKFFLDYKTLWTEVEPFLFYVMTLADSEGCHTVGYFSKEKNSVLNYNVSCILTLPPYQRKGYGRLLIDFSYLLTRVEGKIGSPEKPLSDLGLISYRSYWKDVLLDYLCTRTGSHLNIKDLSQEMAIYSYDIVSTLQALGMMKYWKGKHIILKKQDVLDEYRERVRRRGAVLKIDPTCLRWTPFTVPSAGGSSS